MFQLAASVGTCCHKSLETVLGTSCVPCGCSYTAHNVSCRVLRADAVRAEVLAVRKQSRLVEWPAEGSCWRTACRVNIDSPRSRDQNRNICERKHKRTSRNSLYVAIESCWANLNVTPRSEILNKKHAEANGHD